MALQIHVFLAKIQVPIWTCLFLFVYAPLTTFVAKF